MSFMDGDTSPHIDQLALIAQSCAILRRSEYV